MAAAAGRPAYLLCQCSGCDDVEHGLMKGGGKKARWSRTSWNAQEIIADPLHGRRGTPKTQMMADLTNET